MKNIKETFKKNLKFPETGKRNGDLFLISILSIYFNKFLCLVTAQPILYLRPDKSK